jgi:hypothetical protein
MASHGRWMVTLQCARVGLTSFPWKGKLLIISTRTQDVLLEIDRGMDDFVSSEVTHLWFAGNDDQILIALRRDGRLRQWFLKLNA